MVKDWSLLMSDFDLIGWNKICKAKINKQAEIGSP